MSAIQDNDLVYVIVADGGGGDAGCAPSNPAHAPAAVAGTGGGMW